MAGFEHKGGASPAVEMAGFEHEGGASPAVEMAGFEHRGGPFPVVEMAGLSRKWAQALCSTRCLPINTEFPGYLAFRPATLKER